MSDRDKRPLALIVDDSPVLALQLARQLEALGWHAHTPADRQELHQLAGRAGVMLIELQQFAANGFQLTRELAAAGACPLILLTGTGRGTDLHWGLRAGAAAVLPRPVQACALQAVLPKSGGGTEAPC